MTSPTSFDNGSHDASLRYDRDGDIVRLAVKHMTVGETRNLLVGLWACFDEDVRIDVIRELSHYTDNPFSPLAPLALTIRQVRHDSEHDDDGATGDIRVFVRERPL
jgi:hypothetical protein